jgi:hypothetical protein
MTSYPKRCRYTHKIIITKTENTVFTGLATPTMVILGHPTTDDFQLAITSSGICRVKIVGSLDGQTITERLSFSVPETQYTINTFDELTSLTSGYQALGVTLNISAVDSIGMPLSWSQIFGPYHCEFGSHSGMNAQVEANSLGLGSKTVHYVRVERKAPVSKDMTFTINGFNDIFIPVSEFENISAPPNYVAQEWAFRATKKQDGV